MHLMLLLYTIIIKHTWLVHISQHIFQTSASVQLSLQNLRSDGHFSTCKLAWMTPNLQGHIEHRMVDISWNMLQRLMHAVGNTQSGENVTISCISCFNTWYTNIFMFLLTAFSFFAFCLFMVISVRYYWHIKHPVVNTSGEEWNGWLV